jgi:hypothetical protein
MAAYAAGINTRFGPCWPRRIALNVLMDKHCIIAARHQPTTRPNGLGPAGMRQPQGLAFGKNQLAKDGHRPR